MARLTFCVPTWNGAAFLERTLDSLLAVRGPAIEIVVGDDASDDGTAELARRIASEHGDGRITVHAFRERLGLAGNWNRTLRLARGELLCLFGQDDVCRPEFAERLASRLERHRDCGLAFGRRDFAVADDATRATIGDFFTKRYPEMMRPFETRVRELGEVIPSRVMVDEALRFQFEINLIGEPSFVVFRRDHPAVAGGFDEKMEQLIDWEFFSRFFAAGPVARCHDVIGTYHVHQHGSSQRNRRLSRHYREFGYLLGVVLERFAGALTPADRGTLETRREEVARLALDHEAR
ncbi:MAG: glycosyltransferase family 2 protein, partial [Planctomycetes bacterium]|nr:glycosyltransferase family 2 protein [Planctomycetota bacterium]